MDWQLHVLRSLLVVRYVLRPNPYEDQKELLSNKMIIVALIIPVITVALAEVGLFNFFGA